MTLQKLIEMMPWHMRAVIKAKLQSNKILVCDFFFWTGSVNVFYFNLF